MSNPVVNQDDLLLNESSDLFNAGWYESAYADASHSSLAPVEHYL